MNDRSYENPISTLRGLWNGARSQEKRAAIDLCDWRNKIRVFLERLTVDSGGCFDLHKAPTGRMKCQCMTKIDLRLNEQHVAVVDYLIMFATMTKTEQETLVLEWMRYAQLTEGQGRAQLCYFLPGSNIHRICKHALAKVCGLGERPWRRITLYLKQNLQPRHKLENRESNRALPVNEKIQLMIFFETMLELGAPRATKLVRSITAEGKVHTELRDDEVELIELPSCYSKRHLWRRFLHDNGWDVKLDGKGRVIEEIKVEGEEQTIKSCVSWPCFLQFWGDFYPQVVIQRPTADICDECFVFANQHKYSKRKKEEAEEKADDSDDGLSELVSRVRLDDNEEQAEQQESEQRVLDAAKHVERARKQRELFNAKKREAKTDKDKPRCDRSYCFVADFAQNMSVPNFAADQPGATYYFSPMNVYPFGIVDCSTEPSHLHAYCYYEGIFKKEFFLLMVVSKSLFLCFTKGKRKREGTV